ncbi:MAG: class III extradiol dioxygenase subunit B-like domain-containing protein, partial [Dysosmobacter sp.]|uniref:class III extradiol dioxygenase subunit B-like domain-containing protein n=1 Tax=Dysosmobacter sp. TaxID=2591382 RepID=UPI00284C7EB0
MPMLGAILTPHPPVLLSEVGRGKELEIEATARAMGAAAAEVARWDPDVLIVSSPHTILYGDYFHISPGSSGVGSMAAFGAPQVRIEAQYDAQLRDEIVCRAQAAGLEAGTLGERDPQLDHGVLIPLTFLRRAGVVCPIVRMGLSGFSALAHYRLGRCVAEAVRALGRRAVFVASGDLSHKLRSDGPYGFAPEGPVFERAVTEAMASGDFLRFLTMDPSLCERAAECGLRSFQMMAGALDGLTVAARLLSHEGPFGVGYAVALFRVTGRNETRCFAEACEQAQRARLKERRDREDAWVRLARLSLETYVRT